MAEKRLLDCDVLMMDIQRLVDLSKEKREKCDVDTNISSYAFHNGSVSALNNLLGMLTVWNNTFNPKEVSN